MVSSDRGARLGGRTLSRSAKSRLHRVAISGRNVVTRIHGSENEPTLELPAYRNGLGNGPLNSYSPKWRIARSSDHEEDAV